MNERTFTLPDQRRFAALSGDYNPIHLDATVARRAMLGGTAVHGIHALLWALDCLAAETPFGCFGKLRVNFDRGILIDEKVRCTWNVDETRWIGRITGATGTLARLSLVPLAVRTSAWRGQTETAAVDCAEPETGDLANLSGAFDLCLPETWRTLFPHLAAVSPPAMIAGLLATSCLVGMRCPGLHSIYSALRLDYLASPDAETSDDLHLKYKVICADPRVPILDMAVEAGPLRGVINTLVRPKPYAQPSLASLRDVVPPSVFARQNALVVGGSRGLGELASKLLVAGGARVTLTWRQGEADALARAQEAKSLGFLLQTMKFDVANPPSPPVPSDQRYTHLYYFATPHIRHGGQGQFKPSVFAELLECYVRDFARTVHWFRPQAEADACIWYPSTVFITEMNPDFSEYGAAKACGETLCRHLATQLAPMKFVTPRLPRLPTDQTHSLAGILMADGVTTLLDALLALG